MNEVPITNQFQVMERAGTRFRPHRRKCDDAHENFVKIRNKQLWGNREEKLCQKQESTINENQKMHTQEVPRQV